MKEQEAEEPGLAGKIKEYVRIRKDLAILIFADKASGVAGSLVSGGILVFLGLLIFFFGSLGLGFYLSEILGNSYGGFFIITGFYILAAIIVLLVKQKHIEQPFADKIIKKILKERNESIYEKQD
jgi:uncharacterized membrane protein